MRSVSSGFLCTWHRLRRYPYALAVLLCGPPQARLQELGFRPSDSGLHHKNKRTWPIGGYKFCHSENDFLGVFFGQHLSSQHMSTVEISSPSWSNFTAIWGHLVLDFLVHGVSIVWEWCINLKGVSVSRVHLSFLNVLLVWFYSFNIDTALVRRVFAWILDCCGRGLAWGWWCELDGMMAVCEGYILWAPFSRPP